MKTIWRVSGYLFRYRNMFWGTILLAIGSTVFGIAVPMGYTSGTIPAGITFMGLPFSEPVLIKLGYAYEQATQHRIPPASTPPL